MSIQFGALEWSKRFFGSRKPAGQQLNLGGPGFISKADTDTNVGELWASGVIAGVANTVVANPVEHIRIRLQTQPDVTPRLYSGPLDCAVKLYRAGGVGGVMKGQVLTMWRDGLGYGSYFLAYEWLVQRHMNREGMRREDISPIWAVTYGAAAGYALWGTSVTSHRREIWLTIRVVGSTQ